VEIFLIITSTFFAAFFSYQANYWLWRKQQNLEKENIKHALLSIYLDLLNADYNYLINTRNISASYMIDIDFWKETRLKLVELAPKESTAVNSYYVEAFFVTHIIEGDFEQKKKLSFLALDAIAEIGKSLKKSC